MPQLLTLWSTAFAISALLVFLCRKLALRYNFVVRPTDDRWHRRPTPALGGVAIVATVLLSTSVAGGWSQVWLLLLGGGIIFLVGFVDDLINLKPYSKLVAEIAIASLFVFFGYRLNWTESLTLDALFTLVWIVGLTNAFNLLDNMDGLCGGHRSDCRIHAVGEHSAGIRRHARDAPSCRAPRARPPDSSSSTSIPRRCSSATAAVCSSD